MFNTKPEPVAPVEDKLKVTKRIIEAEYSITGLTESEMREILNRYNHYTRDVMSFSRFCPDESNVCRKIREALESKNNI
jgi:hypothetical protein